MYYMSKIAYSSFRSKLVVAILFYFLAPKFTASDLKFKRGIFFISLLHQSHNFEGTHHLHTAFQLTFLVSIMVQVDQSDSVSRF